MNLRFLILLLSVSGAAIVLADDFETRGERTAVQRQLDPMGLPGWNPLKPVSQSPHPESAEASLKSVQQLNKKLDAITIPKIALEDKPLREALSWIRDETKRLDAKASEPNKGINILMKFNDAVPTAVPTVTLHLNNVTVRQALNQLALLLNARIEVLPYAVALRRD